MYSYDWCTLTFVLNICCLQALYSCLPIKLWLTLALSNVLPRQLVFGLFSLYINFPINTHVWVCIWLNLCKMFLWESFKTFGHWDSGNKSRNKVTWEDVLYVAFQIKEKMVVNLKQTLVMSTILYFSHHQKQQWTFLDPDCFTTQISAVSHSWTSSSDHRVTIALQQVIMEKYSRLHPSACSLLVKTLHFSLLLKVMLSLNFLVFQRRQKDGATPWLVGAWPQPGRGISVLCEIK